MPKRKLCTQCQTRGRLMTEIADGYVCPIAHELPLDPVLAEDGRVYERAAIVQWMSRSDPLRSPVTNLEMGRRLSPVPQVKNTIKALVTSGDLTGHNLDAWLRRIEDEKEVESTRARANGGDGRAAARLGFWHANGHKHLVKDEQAALHWYKLSADFGDVYGLKHLGLHFYKAQNISKAMLYLGQASYLGSESACFWIGKLFSDRLHMDAEPVEAIKWFESMPCCSVKDASDGARRYAKDYLESVRLPI